MKHTETIAPAAAAVSALATLVCCLPLGIAAGTAAGSLAVVAGSYRWWFLGVSALLITTGAVQLARVRRTCRTRNSAGTVVLSISAVIVLLVALLPQVVAGLIAVLLP